MPTRSVTELEGLLDQLEKQAAATRLGEILDAVSGAIAKLFGVQPDEVAILELQRDAARFSNSCCRKSFAPSAAFR